MEIFEKSLTNINNDFDSEDGRLKKKTDESAVHETAEELEPINS